MRFPFVTNLRQWGVYDPGIANSERIVFQNKSGIYLDLSQYFIVLGWTKDDGAIPIPNRLYWFGAITVDPDSWIYVYTGPGETRFTTVGPEKDLSPAAVFHWGLEKAVFNDRNIVPILVEVGATTIGPSPKWLFEQATLPQLGSDTKK